MVNKHTTRKKDVKEKDVLRFGEDNCRHENENGAHAITWPVSHNHIILQRTNLVMVPVVTEKTTYNIIL